MAVMGERAGEGGGGGGAPMAFSSFYSVSHSSAHAFMSLG